MKESDEKRKEILDGRRYTKKENTANEACNTENIGMVVFWLILESRGIFRWINVWFAISKIKDRILLSAFFRSSVLYIQNCLDLNLLSSHSFYCAKLCLRLKILFTILFDSFEANSCSNKSLLSSMV